MTFALPADLGRLAGAPIRMDVLIGPPGCGKSTWCAHNRPSDAIHNLDTYRIWLTGSADDQSMNREAVDWQERDMHARLRDGQLVVVDATSTVARFRAADLQAAARYGYRARAVVFRTPLRVCLDRNAGRERVVPDHVIERKWAEVAALTADDLYAEGFADVLEVAACAV